VIALVPRLAPPAEPVSSIDLRMPAQRARARERAIHRAAAGD
jgi:hypothetical protein